jgi:hypothetical protein
MDFLNRALEQAKQLEQIAVEAAQKGIEQAKPLVREGVVKAQELQKTIIEQTPHVTAAAQEQANAALQHAGTFIATGKTFLEAGAAGAQQHLNTFADQAKKAADATITAVQSASAQAQQKADAAAAGAAAPAPPPPAPPPPPTPPTPPGPSQP